MQALALLAASIAPISPLASQDEPQATQTEVDDGRVVIDLTEPVPDAPYDAIAAQDCEDDADAARIANEIVVCRQLGETSDGVYDHQAFIKRYAEATQGVQTPDVDGTGLPNGMVPLVTIRGCFIPPCPPPPALIIDVEGLPNAPAGSDADRIARGLAPLGEDGDQGREEDTPISEEELGLPPVPKH